MYSTYNRVLVVVALYKALEQDTNVLTLKKDIDYDIELELEKDKCGKNTCLCVGGWGWKPGSETLENETWKSISYRMERMVGLDNCGNFNWFGTTRYV